MPIAAGHGYERAVYRRAARQPSESEGHKPSILNLMLKVGNRNAAKLAFASDCRVQFSQPRLLALPERLAAECGHSDERVN